MWVQTWRNSCTTEIFFFILSSSLSCCVYHYFIQAQKIVCNRKTIILIMKTHWFWNNLNYFLRWEFGLKSLKKSAIFWTWKFLFVTNTDFDVILWQKKFFLKCLRPILSLYVTVSDAIQFFLQSVIIKMMHENPCFTTDITKVEQMYECFY